MKILSVHDSEEALKVLEKELLKRKERKLGKSTKIKNEYFWTMKNGEKIDITEMTNSHLKNTINLLKWHIKNDAYIDFCYEQAASGFSD